MSIKHIFFFIYLRPLRSQNRLQIPGMDLGSSSSDAPPIPGMDPGSSTSNGADPEHGSRVLLLRCGKDPRHESCVLRLRCPADPGYFFFLLPSHNNPPLEFVCPFLYILYFPHTIATTLLWNLFVCFFTFFTFLTGWQRPFLEFGCLLLCILYFPHTTAKPTPPRLLTSFKNIKTIIMLIEHTY
jgi:hypothetical protein